MQWNGQIHQFARLHNMIPNKKQKQKKNLSGHKNRFGVNGFLCSEFSLVFQLFIVDCPLHPAQFGLCALVCFTDSETALDDSTQTGNQLLV